MSARETALFPRLHPVFHSDTCLNRVLGPDEQTFEVTRFAVKEGIESCRPSSNDPRTRLKSNSASILKRFTYYLTFLSCRYGLLVDWSTGDFGQPSRIRCERDFSACSQVMSRAVDLQISIELGIISGADSGAREGDNINKKFILT